MIIPYMDTSLIQLPFIKMHNKFQVFPMLSHFLAEYKAVKQNAQLPT